MSKTSNKIQSEFDQKLRESMAGKASLDPAVDRESVAEGSVAENTTSANVIPVIEEQIQVDKQTVETARVHISKKVREENIMVNLPKVQEEIEVERVAVNKFVETAPEIRYEGDTTIIPVMREEAVVVKRLVLVEELHVTKRIVRTQDEQQVTLRKEELNVDRENNPDLSQPASENQKW